MLVQANRSAHAMRDDSGASKNALNAERRNRDQFVRTAKGREPHDDVQKLSLIHI